MPRRLMWKEFPVCELDPFKALNPNLVPFDLTEVNIQNFLESRQLLTSRVHLKEIFNVCNLTDQTSSGLQKLSNNQSLTDCYWIQTSPNEHWSQINLYDNSFTQEVADAALTGKVVEVSGKVKTSEHNLKGTHAKCFVRKGSQLYLCKKMPKANVQAELRAAKLAEQLGIPHVNYKAYVDGAEYFTMCELFTNKDTELLHYRMIMSMFHEQQMSVASKAFKFFYDVNPVQTLQMILFDCFTHNIDRNRDNFGLLMCKGEILGHAPLFDHDACFRANEQGHYFVTNTTFAEALKWVKTQPAFSKAILPFNKKWCMDICQQKKLPFNHLTMQFNHDYSKLLTYLQTL